LIYVPKTGRKAAFSLPIPLANDVPTTLLSLVVAILTSGFALTITSGRRLTILRLAGGAVVMGAGISTMHYMGMAAITIVPAIAYERWLVACSVLMLWVHRSSLSGCSTVCEKAALSSSG